MQYLLNTNFAASETMPPDQCCCDLDKYILLLGQIHFAIQTNTIYIANFAATGTITPDQLF